jgi:uncharacterized membrane protein
MDLSFIILLVALVVISIIIMIRKGLKEGSITLLFIFGCAVIYTLAIKFWGDEGKKYLAVCFGVIALIVLLVRKKRGESIW